jgi:hypothetical protein
MAHKTRLFLMVGGLLLALLACNLPGATSSPNPPPTAVVAITPIVATPTTPLEPTLPPTEGGTPTPRIEATATQPPAPGGEPFTVTSIHMLDTSSGWAIGGSSGIGDRVYTTRDGGLTWQDVTPPETAGDVQRERVALGFFQSAAQGWVTYFNQGGAPPIQAVVWRTADGGQSWQSSQPLDLSGLEGIYDPSHLLFADAQAGWLLAHVGVGMNHDYVVLYRTSDGGTTWTRLLDPYNDGGIQICQKTGLQFSDAQHGWLTGTCNGVAPGVFLFKSSDGAPLQRPVTLTAPPARPACSIASK